MQNKRKHINRYLVELEKEQQEFKDKQQKYKKNITKMKQFGGHRLLGYIEGKPLIAQYKINSHGFSMKFNQQILDKEYAGSFNKKFLNSNLEFIQMEDSLLHLELFQKGLKVVIPQ